MFNHLLFNEMVRQVELQQLHKALHITTILSITAVSSLEQSF